MLSLIAMIMLDSVQAGDMAADFTVANAALIKPCPQCAKADYENEKLYRPTSLLRLWQSRSCLAVMRATRTTCLHHMLASRLTTVAVTANRKANTTPRSKETDAATFPSNTRQHS
jgi:hypothetical protein